MPVEPAPSRIQSRDDLTAALRMTWRLTIIGLIVMIALITYSAFEYWRLQKSVAEKRQTLDQLNKQIDAQQKLLAGQKTVLDQIGKDAHPEYDKALSAANAESVASNAAAAPLANVIVPKATATPTGKKSSKGDPMYDFQLWLDVPADRKSEIQSVEYLFDDPTMVNKRPVGSNPLDGFAVSYTGWGAFHLVVITVNLRQGKPLTLYFDMIKAIGWE